MTTYGQHEYGVIDDCRRCVWCECLPGASDPCYGNVVSEQSEPQRESGGKHLPVITEGQGGWRVYCLTCSEEAQDYIPVCRVMDDWPPTLLVEKGDESATFHVRKDAPDTSQAVSDKIKMGSIGDHILFLFDQRAIFGEGGYTDEELEYILKRKHQSVSASRNLLCRKGYLYDSGERRPTSSGNPAIVWERTDKERTR